MDFSRQAQLDDVVVAIEELSRMQSLISTANRVRSSQWSHLQGLYDEVDKLAKGKSLMPTTDLVVDLANSMVTDAKGLIFRDTYLDRLKLFVPAGDNPSYPDVLMALRILQQALQRFEQLLDGEEQKQSEIALQLVTISAALKIARQDEKDHYAEEDDNSTEDESESEGPDDSTKLDDQSDEDTELSDEYDDQEDDEDGEDEEDTDDDSSDGEDDYYEYVRKVEVRRALDGAAVSAEWFIREDDVEVFNFAKLDKQGFPKYLPPAEGITFVKVQND